MRTITALFVGLGSIGTRHLKNLANLCADRGWALQADALRSDLSRPLRDGVADVRAAFDRQSARGGRPVVDERRRMARERLRLERDEIDQIVYMEHIACREDARYAGHQVLIHDRADLETIIKQLKTIKGVQEVNQSV